MIIKQTPNYNVFVNNMMTVSYLTHPTTGGSCNCQRSQNIYENLRNDSCGMVSANTGFESWRPRRHPDHLISRLAAHVCLRRCFNLTSTSRYSTAEVYPSHITRPHTVPLSLSRHSRTCMSDTVRHHFFSRYLTDYVHTAVEDCLTCAQQGSQM